MAILVALVPGLLAAGDASAQTGAVQLRLAKVTSLTCAFSQVTTGLWKGGAPAAETTPAKLTVTFSDINVDEGTADAGNAFGGAYIVVRYSNDYLHLMQSHSNGALHVTTVLAKESRDGRLLAVHTRHEYTDVRMPGFTSRPEMYLGDCAAS
jgi:hypothetical protein